MPANNDTATMTIPPNNDENPTHDDGTARIRPSNGNTTHDDGIATTTTIRPNHEDNEREASHTSIRQANFKTLNHTRAYRHRLPIFQAINDEDQDVDNATASTMTTTRCSGSREN
jgi:hypothetical protein